MDGPEQHIGVNSDQPIRCFLEGLNELPDGTLVRSTFGLGIVGKGGLIYKKPLAEIIRDLQVNSNNP